MRFGNVNLYLINDGIMWMDGGGAYGLVPRVLWEKVTPPDELNRIPAAMHCLLIESEGKRILVDTGLGDKLTPKQKRNFGLVREEGMGLVAGLAALGLRPEDIDIVIDTHLHADHCGGNTRWADPEGKIAVPTFPRAEYWIQRLEWADACYPNERTQGTYFPENFRPLEERGQLRLLYGDTRVTSEVRCVVTRGHTRAHQSVIIESGGKTAIFLGDAVPRPVTLERIAWVAAYDVEPLESIETKRRLRDWAVEQEVLLIFEHDPQTPLGYLRYEGGRWRVEPVTP